MQKFKKTQHITANSLSEKETAKDANGHTSLYDVESIFEERAEMLLAIEDDINHALFTKLYEKIEYENAFLLRMIATHTKTARDKERVDRTLNSGYFVQRHFPTNII